jgi:SAM-dependent methyltransferase
VCRACATLSDSAFRRSSPKGDRFKRIRYPQQSGDLPCCEGRIQASGASFDKVVCALALHTLQPHEKVALLKEMRRVLRSGGTLHLADFDAPSTPRKGSALRATSYLFGPDSAKPHLDGSWFHMIEQAGFARVRRVKTCSEVLGQVAIVRARRS